jgi:hypothetical protein
MSFRSRYPDAGIPSVSLTEEAAFQLRYSNARLLITTAALSARDASPLRLRGNPA